MLTNTVARPSFPHPLRVAVFVFLLAALSSAVLIWQLERHQRENARAAVYALTQDHTRSAQENIDRALSATYALSALVQQTHGEVSNFTQVVTKMLPFYPGASVLILAPGGVIRHAIPLAGNEKIIGLDLLTDPVMRNESLLARDSGKLTLAGPLELKQGGQGLDARLPIYLDDARGQPKFWGLANVTMRLPQEL